MRPIVRPWSPVCVVAATATSSIRSGGSCGLRRSSSRMHRTTRSSARVWAYMPVGPALPNGVRTPSTKTTSREPAATECSSFWSVSARMLLVGNQVVRRGDRPVEHDAGRRAGRPRRTRCAAARAVTARCRPGPRRAAGGRPAGRSPTRPARPTSSVPSPGPRNGAATGRSRSRRCRTRPVRPSSRRRRRPDRSAVSTTRKPVSSSARGVLGVHAQARPGCRRAASRARRRPRSGRRPRSPEPRARPTRSSRTRRASLNGGVGGVGPAAGGRADGRATPRSRRR